jgi:2-polyprenyl-3-methyl-5-hydroxy-6-metoxy-1,4-benzoquinol methylase
MMLNNEADTRCILCHAEIEWRFSGADWLGMTDRVFSIIRCPQCGLHALVPRPSPQEALRFYPADYEPFQTAKRAASNPGRRWLQRRHWQYRCQAVHRFRDGGTLLDVGCGTGAFMDQLRQDGGRWEAMGTDVNEEALQYASQKLGLTVYQGELHTLHFLAGSFDVITMWDVIEHVCDPIQLLSDAARLLKVGGFLLLSTPNAQCWQANLWGKWWHAWEIPRHLYVFTWCAMDRLLLLAGLKLVRVLHFPSEHYYFTRSASKWLKARFQNEEVWKWKTQFVTASGVLLWPWLYLVGTTTHSSQITLAALKEC